MIAERKLSVREAAAWWARNTGLPAPHPQTIRRWSAGNGTSGVVLRTVTFAGRHYTTEVWLQEFAAATAVDVTPTVAGAAVRKQQTIDRVRRLCAIRKPGRK